MKRALILATFLLVLLGQDVARATETWEAPGQTSVSDDPVVVAALDIGQRFWQERNVHPCPTVSVFTAKDLGSADMAVGEGAYERADESSCSLWVIDWIIVGGNDLTREGLVNLCRVIVHGLGHTAGLDHTASGVMARNSYSRRAIPWPCRTWARSIAKGPLAQRRMPG